MFINLIEISIRLVLKTIATSFSGFHLNVIEDAQVLLNLPTPL